MKFVYCGSQIDVIRRIGSTNVDRHKREAIVFISSCQEKYHVARQSQHCIRLYSEDTKETALGIGTPKRFLRYTTISIFLMIQYLNNILSA